MHPLWKRFRAPLVFGLYLLGAVAFTYPLAANLPSAVTDHVDPLLDAWTLAWQAHQLPRDPAHLFDANRFYPERGALAFHDPMVGLGLFLSPLQWIFDEPVLIVNLGMLLLIALSGYGAYRLGAEVSGSCWAGAVAGSIFAFNSYRLDHLAHLQLQSMGFIPLLYLCLRRYLSQGGRKYAAGIGLFLWLTAACSAYYAMFTWILLAIAIPYEFWRTASWRHSRRILGLGLALTLSALAYLPVALPLMRLRSDFGLERPLANLNRASARPSDYLRSHSRVHAALGFPPPSPERTLFPGVLALGLTALALTRLDRSGLLFLIVGLVALWGSLGPGWGLYRFLHAVVPGLSGARVPPRMAIYVLMAVAILASQGTLLLLRRLPERAVAWAAGLLAFAPLLESFSGPIGYIEAPPLPRVYEWVARLPEGTPLVELPLPPVKRQQENAVYLYWSTSHFQPLANGYGTVVPPVYGQIVSAADGLLEGEGPATLAGFGFRYVIFHRDRYLRSRAMELERRLDAEPELSVAHRTDDAVVYEIRSPRARGDLEGENVRAELLRPDLPADLDPPLPIELVLRDERSSHGQPRGPYQGSRLSAGALSVLLERGQGHAAIKLSAGQEELHLRRRGDRRTAPAGDIELDRRGLVGEECAGKAARSSGSMARIFALHRMGQEATGDGLAAAPLTGGAGHGKQQHREREEPGAYGQHLLLSTGWDTGFRKRCRSPRSRRSC
jgi:hypothetical protein